MYLLKEIILQPPQGKPSVVSETGSPRLFPTEPWVRIVTPWNEELNTEGLYSWCEWSSSKQLLSINLKKVSPTRQKRLYPASPALCVKSNRSYKLSYTYLRIDMYMF